MVQTDAYAGLTANKAQFAIDVLNLYNFNPSNSYLKYLQYLFLNKITIFAKIINNDTRRKSS